jgi:hypothetical protein
MKGGWQFCGGSRHAECQRKVLHWVCCGAWRCNCKMRIAILHGDASAHARFPF